MFVIRVALHVNEDALERFEEQARAETREVPEKFAGCLRYGFHAGVGVPGSFLLYEEWRDRESFEAYRTSDYFRDVGGKLRPLLAAPPESAYFDAELVGPGGA